jgi:type IV pilus assembly protein PilC
MLIFVSDLLKGNLGVFLGIAFLAFVAYKYLMTHESFQIQTEKFLLRIPVFGNILRQNIWATYCRTMSLLLEAGTPILKATDIAGATVGNRFFAKGLSKVYGSLKKGELLSDALDSSGLFPVLVVQLVTTGEASGRVDAMLRKAAEFYEREIRNVVDSLSSLIEPILIVALGGLVGSILISLYLPIFMVGQFIK